MNFERFTGPGSTAPRRAFLDKVFASVISATKTEGKNTSVTEYEGQGTLVAFNRDRAAGQCLESVETIDLTLSGVSLCTDICVPLLGGHSVKVIAGGSGINTTLSLGVDLSGAPQWISYFHGGEGLVHANYYDAFDDCTGSEILNVNNAFSVDCIKGMEGVLDGIYITAFLQFIGTYYFIAHLPLCGGSISSVPNLLTACGDSVPVELQPWLGSQVATGFGGTATISTPITSC